MFLFRENGINFGLKERLKGTRERNKIVEKMDKDQRPALLTLTAFSL